MQRAFAVVLAAGVLAGCGGAKKAAVPKTCPPPPKGIERPALLSWVPTPRGYVYTSAARRNGDVVVSGYSNETLAQARLDWFNTLAGSGRLENGKVAERRNDVKIAFEGFHTLTTITDVLVPVCETRTRSTLTVHFDE